MAAGGNGFDGLGLLAVLGSRSTQVREPACRVGMMGNPCRRTQSWLAVHALATTTNAPLAFFLLPDHIAPGRLAADAPLANRVRSGRKQPQRVRNGLPVQPPTSIRLRPEARHG